MSNTNQMRVNLHIKKKKPTLKEIIAHLTAYLKCLQQDNDLLLEDWAKEEIRMTTAIINHLTPLKDENKS